jgi:LysR family glycine cleavage system transcriptional activator
MKLPPMNALRAFEAVSRLGSVSKAAEELCVSQGAVSQQLRNLEDHLDRELFIRTSNSFTLSEDGEDFAEVVQRSLGEIALAAGKVKREKTQGTLTISTGPVFGDKWLMPKLGDFYGLYPDITIAIDKNLNHVTFKNDGIDAAIRFGDGKFEDLQSVYLFSIAKYAVASPDYISEHGTLDSLANPERHRLIDCRRGSKDLDTICGLWEDVVARDYVDLEEQLIILPDDLLAVNAALHGRGIALAFNYQIEDEVEAGNLVYANSQPVVTFRGGFYFVSPTNARPNSNLDAFRDWLIGVSEEFRTEVNSS